MKRLVRGEGGSVLAFTTLSMMALLSFGAGVMDIGQMFQTRRQLQNAMDGAALAGAAELAVTGSQVIALNAAEDYAQLNGVSVAGSDLLYPRVTSVGPYTVNAVEVSATRRLNLLVAGLLKNGVGDVRAQATAVIAPVLPTVPTADIWPWGVPQFAIVYGQPIDLKVGSPPPSPGNFGAVDFDGGGANAYRDQIQNGYGNSPGDYIGALPWVISTKTGNMAGPTRQGVDYVVGVASSSGQDNIFSPWNTPLPTCSWANAPKTTSDPNVPPPAGWVGNASLCYRIGVIPIVDSIDVNGNKPVTIIDWGAFYLIGATGNGGRADVWGYFLDRAMVNGGHNNWGAPLTGLIGVRLWQ